MDYDSEQNIQKKQFFGVSCGARASSALFFLLTMTKRSGWQRVLIYSMVPHPVRAMISTLLRFLYAIRRCFRRLADILRAAFGVVYYSSYCK